MTDFTKFQSDPIKHSCSAFAPVFTPGLANKELVDDNGLKQAMSYLDNSLIGCNELTFKSLYNRFPKAMVDEMINSVTKRVPHATESQIVMTILSHL